MLISDNRKQIRTDWSDHQANRYYLIAVIMFALIFFSSLAYATEGNSSHDHNASSNTTNSSLHVHPDTNLSVAFLMKNAGEQIKVNIEDFGTKNPVSSEPHGFPVRFFKANARNISYETLTINASYSEMELNGTDEEKLVISRHEHSNSTWIMLPTKVNKEGNTLETTTDSLSLFAISSHSGNSSDHIHNNTAEIINSSSHNHMDNETKPISVSFIGPDNTKIILELDSRNSPDSPFPGSPIKFFRIDAGNLSYNKVNIELAYTDQRLNGTDENNLSIFHYTNSTWIKLPTEINGDKNTLSASVESLSLFAISSFSGEGHNMSMDMGIVSDCLRCHGGGRNYSSGMMEGMTPKVNEDIMNLSIHADLNDASSDLNKACWACHSNSTTPPTKHPMHNPALTCDSCHINMTGKFNSLRTTEHTLHAANITVNASCQLCHGKSQMINFNGSTVNSTISHYGKKRTDMLDSNKTSTNCSYCHQNPGSEFSDVFNKTSRTNITHNGGLSCSSCHGTGRLHNSTPVNMQDYSLSNCVQCHGIGGFAINKLSESIMNQSIHANLNNGSLDLNRACWSCHSNMITTPLVHPDIAKLPNTCSSCHIDGVLDLAGKIKPGHFSSHGPGSSQIRTPACTTCHINEILASGKTTNSTVSHYAKYPTVDTRDCISCHQNREISKKWGNPPDPRDTITLSSVEKKMVSDDIWRINQNYSIAISEVDKEGSSVWVELYYNDRLILKELVPEGGSFKHETKLARDNKTVIDLRIADIFYGGQVSLITFSGLVPEHMHTETTSIQCYACHVKEYRSDKPDGQRYFVLKKDDPNVTLNPIDIDFAASDKKLLYSNNSWNLGSGYELYIKDFSPDRKYVWLVLTKEDMKVKEEFVSEGEYFTFNTIVNGEDITMLRLKVANIFIKG